MVNETPLCIGIAGGSASGKSTLAEGLAKRLKPRTSVVFAMDWYYHDLAGIPEMEINVDVPQALEFELLISHVRQLLMGRPIERPDYVYATHSRKPRGILVEPADCVIVEGLYALYFDELRDLLNLGVYIEIDIDVARKRRIKRDLEERDRDRESIVQMFDAKVAPMHGTYVEPTKRHADLIVTATTPRTKIVSEVVTLLRRRSSG